MEPAPRKPLDVGGAQGDAPVPDHVAIRQHLELLVAPMRGEWDDGLVEIAWNNGDGPDTANLYPLDKLDDAVEHAACLGLAGRNAWIGTSLKKPGTPNKRSTAKDFYAAAYIVVDIDADCAAVLAKLPFKPSAVVWTGSTPEPRAQAWIKLRTPCDDPAEYEAAQAALVAYCGGDENAKGAGRLMRLAGSVSFPNPGKRAKGYVTELTRLELHDDAEAVDIMRLIALAPTSPAARPEVVVAGDAAAGGDGVSRDDQGRIMDGRRGWLRDQLLTCIREHQAENFDDPEVDELVQRVETRFFDPVRVNHDDGKWTSANGKMLVKREAGYALSRLRKGELATYGLASHRTRIGEEEADRVAAERTPFDVEELGIFQAQKAAGQKPKPSQKPSKGAKTAHLVSAASLTPERVNWLWSNWLAAGKLHILAGQPGTGKTTVAIKVAATITSGGLWADGGRAIIGNVLMWSAEDGIEDTLLPRFKAAGGDDALMHFVRGVSVDGAPRSFDPAEDMDALTAAARALGSVSMLIVDPVVQAVAGDSHKTNEVRRGLQPLVDFAEEFGCAVLGISHFSKGSAGRAPIERITGSMAFGALARLVWFAAVQEGDEETGDGERRVLIRAKSNLGPNGDGFEYGMDLTTVPGHDDIQATRIVFGDEVKGGPAALLADLEGDSGDRSALEEAKEFLIDILRDGKVPAADVEREAKSRDIKIATLKRAKSALRVKSVKSEITGGWYWVLPNAEQGDQ